VRGEVLPAEGGRAARRVAVQIHGAGGVAGQRCARQDRQIIRNRLEPVKPTSNQPAGGVPMGLLTILWEAER